MYFVEDVLCILHTYYITTHKNRGEEFPLWQVTVPDVSAGNLRVSTVKKKWFR